MKLTKIMFGLTVLIWAVGCEQQTIEPNLQEVSGEMNHANTEIAVNNTGGSFTVLTYNVAGLPAFLSSGNPEANTAPIGQLIRNYDIVHVQEDFNYHATLYANDNHTYRTPTSGGVPFGDGLNTLSNYPYTGFQRIKWNDCNGTDCLTPKGFTVARHRLAEGVYIDFYNAHPNAGTANEDLAARRSNITQLKNFISSYSEGNAVILMGDLNCRYTRTEDNIRELSTLALEDAWIVVVKGGVEPAAGDPALVCDNAIAYEDPQCEIVDKIFYRGNELIDLSALSFSYEEDLFRDENGEMLSDHRPIAVTFNYNLSSNLLMSDQFGGPHGTPFTDVDDLPSSPDVHKVFIRSGSRLDQVGISLTNGSTNAHGGNGGSYQELVLQNGEYITEAKLWSDQKSGRTRIFRVEFRTNFNRVLGGGNTTGNQVTYSAPAGYQVVGFHGRAGSEIDKLGLIYAPI